jgi:hypothetical protein
MVNLEYVAIAVIWLGIAKLVAVVGLQLFGDLREALRQASIKRLGAQKRPYTPIMSVHIDADTLLVPIAAFLDSVRASTYQPAEIVIVVSPDSPTYYQARKYRKVHNLSNLITIRKRSATLHWLTTTKQKKAKGKIVLLLDGSSTLLPDSCARGIVPFRDRSVAAVIPSALPCVTTSLSSGFRAARHIVSMHFRRGRAPKASNVYGALFIREAMLRRIARKHPEATTAATLKDMITMAQGLGKGARVVRHSDAAVLAQKVRFASLPSIGASLWWIVDIVGIWAVLYIFGGYDGVIILGFIAIFALFLAIMAILSTRGIRTLDKLNLILLIPFVYVCVQLVAPLWWATRKS